MDFKKDLLLVDLETTGLDAQKHEIIQIAAILLDKKTLKEKEIFSSFVCPLRWKNRDPESMKVNGIKWEQLKNAPDLKTVLRALESIIETSRLALRTRSKNIVRAKSRTIHNIVLSYYGGPLDMDFMREAYRKTGLKWQFDYHYFNLWAFFYAFLASKNKLKNSKKFTGFSLDDFMKEFKIKSNSRHDALEDCRIEAEVLRRIMQNLK